MKWLGVILMSGVKGIFLAELIQAFFPTLAGAALVITASVGTVLILDTLIRLARTASTIEVRRSVLIADAAPAHRKKRFASWLFD